MSSMSFVTSRKAFQRRFEGLLKAFNGFLKVFRVPLKTLNWPLQKALKRFLKAF
jgi:hypothetical protein